MVTDNPLNTENLDDDILQSRADILRARRQSNPASNKKNKSSDTAAKTVKIPDFEELISKEQVINAKWETPLPNPAQEKTKAQTDKQFTIEIEKADPVTIPSSGQLKHEQIPSTADDKLVELNMKNIVTAAEEMALFSTNDNNTDANSENVDLNEGLDALRKAVSRANETDAPPTASGSSAVTPAVPEKIEIEEAESPGKILLAASDNENAQSIPRFDLAEKILTEQRRIAAKRRQRPTMQRNINNIMQLPISGTVGQVIEETKKKSTSPVEKIELKTPPRQSQEVQSREIAETKPPIIKPETASISTDKINSTEQTSAEAQLEKTGIEIEFDLTKAESAAVKTETISIEIGKTEDTAEPEIKTEKMQSAVAGSTETTINNSNPKKHVRLSPAAIGIIKNAGHLNKDQQMIIADIVQKDIERYCRAS